MPEDVITPAPPAPPVIIPVGLSTKIGYVLGLVLNLAGALMLALEGLPDDASSSVVIVTLFAAGAAAIIRVNDGRQAQAAAVYAAAPAVAPMLPSDFQYADNPEADVLEQDAELKAATVVEDGPNKPL